MHELEVTSRIRIFRVMLSLLFVISQQGTSWATDARQQQKMDFGTGVEVGVGLVKYHHTCIWFRIFFISHDFFAGLKEIKTPAGPTFEKQGIRYDKFPEHLIVDVQATVHACPSGYGTPPDYGSSLIEGASFEANWQGIGDTQMRPTSLISAKMLHRLGVKWDYFLEIEAKDVPLTDTLDVDVSLRQGISQAHLQATLTTGMR